MNETSEELSNWSRRAESFVRQLNYLPGEWGISISARTPLTSDEAESLEVQLPLGFPTPLRALYLSGATDRECTYHWTPPKEARPAIEGVFGSQSSFGGGPHFIPATEILEAHGIQSWWEGVDAPASEKGRVGREVWRRTVPFIKVGNGDVVGLYAAGDSAELPVVYLCHDDEECPVSQLSPSLGQFLADWEKLCYIGPEIWLLDAFLSADRDGYLESDGPKARRWREILATYRT